MGKEHKIKKMKARKGLQVTEKEFRITEQEFRSWKGKSDHGKRKSDHGKGIQIMEKRNRVTDRKEHCKNDVRL